MPPRSLRATKWACHPGQDLREKTKKRRHLFKKISAPSSHPRMAASDLLPKSVTTTCTHTFPRFSFPPKPSAPALAKKESKRQDNLFKARNSTRSGRRSLYYPLLPIRLPTCDSRTGSAERGKIRTGLTHIDLDISVHRPVDSSTAATQAAANRANALEQRKRRTKLFESRAWFFQTKGRAHATITVSSRFFKSAESRVILCSGPPRPRYKQRQHQPVAVPHAAGQRAHW